MPGPPRTPDELIERYVRGERDFSGADLERADLAEASLSGAKLVGANLRAADLSTADLSRADLSGANLSDANLSGANLTEAELSGAHLNMAHLYGAGLSRAKLFGANLSGANLSWTNLGHADLSEATVSATTFADVDMSMTSGLANIHHGAPSSVGTNTLARSMGRLPRAFLEGCGLQDWEIISAQLYDPRLTHDQVNDIQYRAQVARCGNPIQVGALFISYAHADADFVDALEQRFRKKGIRFWRDTHAMLAGRMEAQVDRAIRLHDQVLLVLSKDAVNSDWVEHEVRRAREREKSENRDVLCPIRLDDTWRAAPWPARLMDQVMEYNILDFSGWRDGSAFDDAFAKLLAGLVIFYKSAGSAR